MENRYDKYKDSGVEWIGEIPVHWEIIKIKNAFYIISGATPKTDNMAYWDGEITWITPADYNTEDKIISSGKRNITLAGLNSCGTSIVPEGSIIFSKRAPIGLVAINVVPLCTNQGCISCIPKPSVNTKYFYYLMSVLTDWFELFGSGTTFKELSTNNFANFILSQPPFSEQQFIAAYLDQKCGEIDELITLQEEMITKLQGYKQSVITEAVTKGLDKNVPLKDSGIEWIGEIPEHWGLVSIGKLFNIYAGGDAKPNYYSVAKDLEHPFPVYTNTKSECDVYAYTSKAIFPANTITVTGRGDVGHAIYRKTPYDAIIRLLSLIPKNNYDCKFYTYFIDVVIPFMDGRSAVAQLSALQLKPQIVCFPPISEQQSIADYLDQRCGEIEELISIKQQKIEKLKEYKKSLIFECVTGKRKVC